MSDNASSIVVFEVSVFENGSYNPSAEFVCRKKAEVLDFRKGLDYLFALDIIKTLDLTIGDSCRVLFRVLNRPRYKLGFLLKSEYLGFYKVKSGVETPVFSCESFTCLTEVD